MVKSIKLIPRNIKKWQKVDQDQLLRAWEQRYASSKHITPTEEEFVSSAAQMKPKTIRYGEKAPKELRTIANVFGKRPGEASLKFQEHLPVTERVERIAQNIEFKVAGQKLGKANQALKNIVSKNPKRFTTKPEKIGKTLPKSDWAHTDKKLTKAILTARKATKPKSVITKGIGERPRTVLIGPMQPYKGIGPARTGQELQMKYEKVASRAMLHGAGAGAQFTKQVIESGKPVRKIKDIQTKFLRKKKGSVPEEQAFLMGFPAKSPGGQFEPYPELSKYSPFKDPSKILTKIEEAEIRSQMSGLYVEKGGKIKSIIPKVSKEQLSQEGYTGITRQQAFKYKDKYTHEFPSGRRMPTKEYKAGLKEYQRKALVRLEEKIPKAYSKKTKALYPIVSREAGGAETKFWKRVESEWGKKKGRTPFDF
jgi:hypothetical protein